MALNGFCVSVRFRRVKFYIRSSWKCSNGAGGCIILVYCNSAQKQNEEL